MDDTALRSLAEIFNDRANAAESDELVEAWSQAADELRRAARGVDVVAEIFLAMGYCPTCGDQLGSNDSDCQDVRHDGPDTLRTPETAPEPPLTVCAYCHGDIRVQPTRACLSEAHLDALLA